MLELIYIEITYRPHVLGSSLEVFFLAGHSVSLTNPDVTEANAAGKSLCFALQAACLFVHRAASSDT